MKRLILACALALPLAACKEDDDVTASGPDPDACNASQYQSLVGRDEAAVAEAGIEPGQKARIFGPGDVLTMDYRSDRINVELDAAGEVVRVYCG
ncbi:I78 family peptidase inhibitor [Maritimibacter dapengensis]|uniref:Peptidase inhibitor I78 family protein n=1 Tax=Maritimibacter dapengensis TaxID=2836868 RepID=A0ABS6T549_9RHOB|nr:I78 family peptidase inhibitor [Maritimibacter dapengensis]MBV7380377.1 hypothetical protein [Maritimibacter dapengensis]